jgi:hypothetical protein
MNEYRQTTKTRRKKPMNPQMRHSIIVPVAVFIALAIAYAILIVTAKAVVDPFTQVVMIDTGSVLLGSGLVFFLIRISASQDQ